MSALKAAFFIKNIPAWERTLRLLLGAGAIAVGVHLEGVVGWLVLVSGVTFATTGVFGFCPMCAMAGRRLPSKS